MKTISVNVYRFNELTPGAKDRARYDAQGAIGYAWETEAFASLRAFAEHFGACLEDYSVDFADCSYSNASFSDVDVEPAELAHLVGELKHDGSCQFTGFCLDDDCNEGAVEAWKAGKRELAAILEAGFREWLRACQADYAAFYSDEGMIEDGEANDRWYYASGRLA